MLNKMYEYKDTPIKWKNFDLCNLKEVGYRVVIKAPNVNDLDHNPEGIHVGYVHNPYGDLIDDDESYKKDFSISVILWDCELDDWVIEEFTYYPDEDSHSLNQITMYCNLLGSDEINYYKF